MKVEQQPQWAGCQLQVGEQLRAVNGSEFRVSVVDRPAPSVLVMGRDTVVGGGVRAARMRVGGSS
jgi:hypothetical protein